MHERLSKKDKTYWFSKVNLEDALMSEAVLQILLVLAYLAIGLIAITFPIYAISVNYLPQEKTESEKERKKRIEKLRKNIAKLTDELSGEKEDAERVSKIRVQIERYKTELEGTELRADYLTAKGAVRNPIIKLVLALLTAGIGIHFWTIDELSLVIIFGFVSGGLSVAALYNLYKTVTAVEYAALRPARTIDFIVEFSLPKSKEKIKVNKASELKMVFGTIEAAVENLTMIAEFPSELEIPVEEEPTAGSTLECVTTSRFPEKTVILYERPFFPRNITTTMNFGILPKKVGQHIIEFCISGKGIREITEEFVVTVVK